MMPKVRLIDANALFNDLKKSAKAAREWREETQDEEIKIRAEQAHGTFVECALRVKNAPTIEAEPVRHGRWKGWTTSKFTGKYEDYDEPVFKDYIYYTCSECYRKSAIKELYCPNCGAKMYADGGTISKERFAETMRGADNDSE